MTLPFRSIVSIEESLASRWNIIWSKDQDAVFSSIASALAHHDFDEAVALVDHMSADTTIDRLIDYTKFASSMAVLAGAGRVTTNLRTSGTGLGLDKGIVSGACDRFILMARTSLVDSLKAKAVQLIALEKYEYEREVPPEGKYFAQVAKASPIPIVPKFQSFMDDQGRAAFQLASSLHTSRLGTLGFTAEADLLGYTDYMLNAQIDGRTSDFCRTINGKVFRVSDARSSIVEILKQDDIEDIKTLQPWPNQSKASIASYAEMSSDELTAKGLHIPPFHPHCRTLCVKLKVRPTLVPAIDLNDLPSLPKTNPLPVPLTLAPEAPKPLKAVVQPLPTDAVKEVFISKPADFSQLGLSVSPAKALVWNTLIDVSPLDFLSKMTGTPAVELVKLVGKSKSLQDIPKALGLQTLKITPTVINLETKAPFLGSLKAVHQDYYFLKDHSLSIGSIELQPEDVDHFKSVMKNLMGLAQLTKTKRIIATAGLDTSGYAFAKYGFTLTHPEWVLLKQQVSAKAPSLTAFKTAGATELSAYYAIMNSTNPDDVYALADLSMGKDLLSGTVWAGVLDLNNPEAMARWHTSMAGQ